MNLKKKMFVLLAVVMCLAGCQRFAAPDRTSAAESSDAQYNEGPQSEAEKMRLEQQYIEERQLEKDLETAAILRLSIITNKLESDNRDEKADGIEELYRLLTNPEIFGNLNDYIDLMTAEDVVFRRSRNLLHIGLRINVMLYKQEDGTYYAEAAYNRSNPAVTAELFVKAVKDGDEDAVFEYVMPSEDVRDGAAAFRKLKETGEYDRIIRTKTNIPDGTDSDLISQEQNNKKRIATYTLDDGSYYDIYLYYMGEKGYLVGIS